MTAVPPDVGELRRLEAAAAAVERVRELPNMHDEARKRWAPFAEVADIAFDDPGEIFAAGFTEAALWIVRALEGDPDATG